MTTGPEPFAFSILVLSGFVRIVANHRIFDSPSTLDQSFAFVSLLVECFTARIVGPGPDHLDIFESLCRESGAIRKLVADAQHAAALFQYC
ncbi:MAG: type II toxin-antitoxin system VapC family toxin [Caldilineaceae bacterium SB0666_bin_21]|nr:type II toxin-antitoxin system VapC family toxin [Caldilineaceae bacterium SB0666_bin_21]